ncbi:MAG: exo-alpha-sialidase [Clostridia bacterium]|nr:exo-alpha-sialidase [Clostridia bacterium]
MLIFKQTKTYSYRDPAAYIENGTIYLFFTLVENTPERQHFYVAMSQSEDFLTWTEPKILTERDNLKNYSSPGNVIKYNGEYYLCLQTYPREDGQIYGNENSRIFTMKSKDLINWEKPALLKVKGDVPEKEMGRMIDPYLLDDGDKFICFFKQNGVSFSTSTDLANWKCEGFTACGENVCVIKENDEYLIFNSPDNGINIMTTKDFKTFTDVRTLYLNQKNKPWAKDRITAGFVIDVSSISPYKYAMFYHGDNEDDYLFGASLAVVFSDDLVNWSEE